MYSLLGQDHKKEQQGKGAALPAFFQDLNLDQILKRVTEDWGQEVLSLYQEFPSDEEEQTYRKEVYLDVKQESVYLAMMDFRRGMREWKLCKERGKQVEDELQKHVWYLREVQCYGTAVETLRDALMKGEKASLLKSRGMKGLLAFLTECALKPDYQEIREEAAQLWNELAGFRILLTYEKERFTLVEGKGTGKYEAFLSECFPGHEKLFRSPFLASDDFSNLESEILKQFRKKHKDFFVRVERFHKAGKPYVHDALLKLFPEMGYYLSFAQFERRMIERGLMFCTPKSGSKVATKEEGLGASPEELSAKGLYDLALAIACGEEGKAVVSNDVLLLPGEDFFVLTGPNQGGKTTYARSLGQMVYFAKMGFDVPAEAATVPYYQKLWTHFSVEESAETGRGKLMDELVRLKPMMGKEEEGSFIVINELFTTAANFDANVMGKRVLDYFIGHHCKGIYVTHLSDLSKACETVVSLRAGVDEKGRQTYEIERSEAQELAGANRQVEKYGLTYRQLKERFS